MTDFDLVIRGGTVADGTGSGTREADVAVKDGKIAAVGKVTGTAAEEIAAKGLLVTPGFVDIHTHYDGQATWDSYLQPSSWHGVTTAVMGNCGVGFAPVKVEDRQRLIELMEGVEDIPGAALDEGLNWSWESFGQYLDALAAKPRDMDLGAQLPHGALRVFVMGERAAKLEEATADEVARMRVLTAEAMRDGALGFSTSRTLNHRTVKGDPTPSLRASEAELLGIALGMKDAGSGVIEFISDFNTPSPESEFEMLDRLLSASGRPFSVSLAQAHRRLASPARAGRRSRGQGTFGQGAGGAAADRRAAGPAGEPHAVLDVPGLQGHRQQDGGGAAGDHARSVVPREAAGRIAGAAALGHGRASHRLRPHVPAGRSARLRAAAGELARRPRTARGPRSARGRVRLHDRR